MFNSRNSNVPPHFPGDPRYGIALSPHPDDVEALLKDEWLSTRLLDYLIQRASPPLDLDASIPLSLESPPFVMVGGLATQFYVESCNELYSTFHSKKIPVTDEDKKILDNDKKRFKKLCASIDAITSLHPNLVFVIPLLINNAHFHVVRICGSRDDINFYTETECFDSMFGPGLVHNNARSGLLKFLVDFNKFVVNFIISPSISDNKLKTEKELHGKLLSRMKYSSCPQQDNCFDCGLFSVAIVLHILDGQEITRQLFSQENITDLRFDLGSHLSSVPNLTRYPLPSELIRKHFTSITYFDDMIVPGVSTKDTQALQSPPTNKSRNQYEG
jgi:hypothetical protein